MNFLVTDLLFYLVILGSIILAKKYNWEKIYTSPIRISASIIFLFFIFIALLDSIHINTKTILDYILSPLLINIEKTYTTPFSKSYLNKDVYSFIKIFCLKTFIITLSFGFIIFKYNKYSKKMAFKSFVFTIFLIILFVAFVLEFIPYYHILGTDKVGYDVFYASVKSIRTGVIIGTLTTLLTLPFAIIFGTLAGFFKGKIDDVIQYLYITLSSIPSILLIAASVLTMQVWISKHEIIFSTMVQRSDLRLLILCSILGLTSWTNLCRLLRAETLKIRELEFIQAAKVLGTNNIKIILKHIIPNLQHIIIVAIAIDFSGLVLAEAVLSYVGVGVDPSTFSWGNMINSARLEMAREPVVWWSLFGSFIMMFGLVLSANIVSDGIRDMFDNRSEIS